jgi:flagellar biosynthetic protein FliO
MRDRWSHHRLVLAAACVVVSLSAASAQTDHDPISAGDSQAQPASDVLPLSGGASLASERQEVTAEELRSLRPAATLIDDKPEQAGEPLSAANRPRSTTSSLNEAEMPIARNPSPETAAAASDQARVVAKDRDKAAGGWFSFSDFLPLGVVLSLILALAWIIRRYRPARAMLGGGGVLEVVARLPVSSKQTLLLVRMGRQLVLLGQSQDQVTMLTEVNDPEEVSSIIGEAVSRTNRSLSHEFAETFESESALYERDLDLDPAEQARGHVRSLVNRVRQLARSREVA